MLQSSAIGLRIISFRTLTGLAETPAGLATLKALLAGKLIVPGVELRSLDRWNLVARLIAMGDSEAQMIFAAEAARDKTGDAEKFAFAALAGDDLHLTFTLGPTELSRSLGYDRFRLAYQITIGRSLTMQLTIANDAEAPLVFEEALHTYYTVADINHTTLTGLENTTYLDKVEAMQAKLQLGHIAITGPTDRVYLDTASTCVLDDASGKRRITIAKTNSNTTVVWNPWESGAQKLPDMDPTEWREFLAVETVNAATNAVTLAPGATHTMQTHVSVEALKA